MNTSKEHTLLLRSFDAALSTEEQRQLESLLAASESARTARVQFEAVRQSVRQYGSARFADGFAGRVLESLASRSAFTRPAEPKPVARIYSMYGTRVMRAAAIVLLLVAVSAVIWLQPRAYTVPHGKVAIRMLPDGSTVQLSSGSSISYKPFWGRATRLVHLEGEAFFDVTHSGKPFVVETFNANIHVLGTRFNVKAWPADADQETMITLEEGRVEVAARNRPSDAHQLEPDQSAVVQADTTLPVRSRTRPLCVLLVWRTGGLDFEDETMASFAAEIERRYAVRLELDDRYAGLRIAYFKSQAPPLREVLDAITQTHQLAYRPTANGYEIFKPQP